MYISHLREDYGLFFPFLGKAVFIAVAATNSAIAKEAEKTSRLRFKAKKEVERTKTTIEGILNTLMPTLVVEELRKLPVNSLPPSHEFKHATIAQSDLCGFTKLASTRKPDEVVQLISEIFGRFDAKSDDLKVYKVETIGDAYIAGMAEMKLTATNSPVNVIKFGLAMVEEVNAWATEKNVAVNCRVGVHHGACIGGIVGTEMQRYHIFGNLMNALEVLESTAPEGGVQASNACRTAAEKQTRDEKLRIELKFEQRVGNELLTSKGEIHTIDEVDGHTHIVTQVVGLPW